MTPPLYTDLYGFAQGAQTHIFESDPANGGSGASQPKSSSSSASSSASSAPHTTSTSAPANVQAPAPTTTSTSQVVSHSSSSSSSSSHSSSHSSSTSSIHSSSHVTPTSTHSNPTSTHSATTSSKPASPSPSNKTWLVACLERSNVVISQLLLLYSKRKKKHSVTARGVDSADTYSAELTKRKAEALNVAKARKHHRASPNRGVF